MRRIGVLTSGGDAPGMNAAVMAVAKAARFNDMTLVGIKRGYNGALNVEQNGMAELDLDTVLDIADQPGTYLRTAGCAGQAKLTISTNQTDDVEILFQIHKK